MRCDGSCVLPDRRRELVRSLRVSGIHFLWPAAADIKRCDFLLLYAVPMARCLTDPRHARKSDGEGLTHHAQDNFIEFHAYVFNFSALPNAKNCSKLAFCMRILSGQSYLTNKPARTVRSPPHELLNENTPLLCGREICNYAICMHARGGNSD